MQLQFSVAMQRFIKKLNISGNTLSFYFNSISTHDEVRYYVSVADSQGKTWLFYMKNKEGRWVLTNPVNCPEWIIALERELSTIITEKTSV